jgi:hypothetical protein
MVTVIRRRLDAGGQISSALAHAGPEVDGSLFATGNPVHPAETVGLDLAGHDRRRSRSATTGHVRDPRHLTRTKATD